MYIYKILPGVTELLEKHVISCRCYRYIKCLYVTCSSVWFPVTLMALDDLTRITEMNVIYLWMEVSMRYGIGNLALSVVVKNKEINAALSH